jgi:propionate CoA-transferase
MSPAIFSDEPMNLRRLLLHIDLAHRVHYDAAREMLFLNFEGMEVRDAESIDEIRATMEATCRKIGKRVAVVVNYDAFRIDDGVANAYSDMVKYLEERYYTQVSRYTTSAFMRMKIGKILTRKVAPHIFESREEAQEFLEGGSSSRTGD